MIAGIPGESHTAATRREARTCWRQGGNYHFTTKNQSTLDYRALLKRKEPTLINLKYIFYTSLSFTTSMNMATPPAGPQQTYRFPTMMCCSFPVR